MFNEPDGSACKALFCDNPTILSGAYCYKHSSKKDPEDIWFQ